MRIFISNLPDDATEEDIKRIFAEHGAQVEAKISLVGDARVCDVSLDADRVTAQIFVDRFIDHHYWKGKMIKAEVPLYE